MPRMVSAIIAKQLAKHPEERYQSAYGLRQDLEACRAQWLERGVVDDFLSRAMTARRMASVPNAVWPRARSAHPPGGV